MVDKIDQEIASRIKRTIESQGESIASVARELGVSHTTVWNWAEGKTTASVERIRALSSVLNVSPCYLAFGVEDAGEYVRRTERAKGCISVPEFTYQASPDPQVRRMWSISDKFAAKVLNADEEKLFLFENIGNTIESLSPGDIVIVNSEEIDPQEHGEGHYLIFRPHAPLVMYVSLSFENNGKYILSSSQDSMGLDSFNKDHPILGKIVGEVKKSNLPIPIKRR